MHPPQHAIIQALDQDIQFGAEAGQLMGGLRIVEGDAPDLLPFRLGQVGEELAEAGDQIAFRHHHVDGELYAQLLLQFVDPLADQFGLVAALGCGKR